ncbi:hypothetical protein PINS_up013072 [Pythium insidiosum]|nr:hypothetical protein PINS_up013072 [Pythium insidiosum]
MMLKFGFQEPVETILDWIPSDRKFVIWSATFPKWVNAMAKKFTSVHRPQHSMHLGWLMIASGK